MYDARSLISIVVLIGLTACQASDPGADATSVDNAVQAEAVYESPGKPQLVPVDVRYRLLDTPSVGQAVGIELTLIPGVDASSVGFTLDAEDGLVVDASTMAATFAAKSAMSRETTIVRVTPSREGRFYLRVNSSIAFDGRTLSRVVTIPIQVGTGGRQLEQMGEIKTDEDGDTVISLPATTKDN